MKRAWDALLSALAYFTIFPVGARAAPNADTLAALAPVGALVGVTAGTAAWLVSFVAPHVFVVAVAFALSVLLTGAVHVDGFLDSCDALFASVAPERRLEILKDPRHGTFAIAWFGVLCVFWLAALWALPVARLPAVLAFSAALARWAAVLNAFIVPDARAGGSARAFAGKPPWLPMLLEAAVFCLAGVGAAKSAFLLCCVVAPCCSLLGGRWAKRCLDTGITGDIYGFFIVGLESMILVLIACV